MKIGLLGTNLIANVRIYNAHTGAPIEGRFEGRKDTHLEDEIDGSPPQITVEKYK